MKKNKYLARQPEFTEALAVAGLSSATELASAAGIGLASAQAVFAGRSVSMSIVLKIVRALRSAGWESTVAETFEIESAS